MSCSSFQLLCTVHAHAHTWKLCVLAFKRPFFWWRYARTVLLPILIFPMISSDSRHFKTSKWRLQKYVAIPHPVISSLFSFKSDLSIGYTLESVRVPKRSSLISKFHSKDTIIILSSEFQPQPIGSQFNECLQICPLKCSSHLSKYMPNHRFTLPSTVFIITSPTSIFISNANLYFSISFLDAFRSNSKKAIWDLTTASFVIASHAIPIWTSLGSCSD